MDHLSSSQINLYLLCGLKYKFNYIDLIPKSFRSSALAFGSAFHSALQWFHEEKMKGKEGKLETPYRIFDADWYSQKLSQTIRFKEGEQEMTMAHLGKEFLAMYAKEDLKPVKGCEVPFTVPLCNPTTGEDLGIPLKGYFDLVEAEDTIVEFKTSAQTLSADDIDSRLQLTAYSYAYQLLYHRLPGGLKVVNFVKSKKPKMIVTETTRDEIAHKGFLYVANEVYRGIKAGIFIPHMGYWCKDCEYAAICPLWQRGKEAPAEQLKLVTPVNAMAQ